MTRTSTHADSARRSRPTSDPKHARSCDERDKDDSPAPRAPPIGARDAAERAHGETRTGKHGARCDVDRQRDEEPPPEKRTANETQQVDRAQAEHDDVVELEVLWDLRWTDQRVTNVRAPSTSVCTTRLSPREAWNAKP